MAIANHLFNFGASLLLAAAHLSSPARAQQAVSGIFAVRAQGLNNRAQQVHLWPGYDTALSFIETAETIRHVKISNLTRTVITSDGTFEFSASGAGSGEARVLYLTPIEPLPTEGSFANLLTAETASLFLIAEQPDGSLKQYVFEIVHETGRPRYNSLAVFPDSRGTPLIELGPLQRARLEHVELGIQVSREQNADDDATIARVREFLALVRNGATLSEATSRAGVGMSVITHLAQLGLTRQLANDQLSLLDGGE